MEEFTLEELEAYVKERRARQNKKKPKPKSKDEVKVDDLVEEIVEEIVTSYTPAVKRAIYNYREKNKNNYNEYTRKYIAERMKDPEFARRKKEATARSNEKVRLRRIAEQDALQSKVKLVKCDTIPVTAENIIIETNNGL